MTETAKGYFKSAIRSIVLDRKEIGANSQHCDQDKRDDFNPDPTMRKKPERRHRDQHCPDGLWRWREQKILLMIIILSHLKEEVLFD